MMKTPSPDPEIPAIEFRQVSIAFDGKPALEEVSFALRPGGMILLTGTSGSGKSVLLRLAIGLLQPDSGQVFINGREIDALSEEALLDLRSRWMGFVFQEDALFSSLSVYDNAAYRLAEHNWSEAETDRAVREILRLVGLEDHVWKIPEELSIGMRRRLEIARALTGWPAIMLYDEPTAGLDPINARHVLDLVIHARDIHRSSSLYVTKELHEIPYLASHVAAAAESGSYNVTPAGGEKPDVSVMLLDGGKMVFFGKLEDFETDRSPSVMEMTHPETLPHPREVYVPGWWKPVSGSS